MRRLWLSSTWILSASITVWSHAAAGLDYKIRQSQVPESKVAWTLPGEQIIDKDGLAFLSSTGPNGSLSLIDRSNGSVKSIYRSNSSFTFSPGCSSSDAVFISERGRVLALSKVTRQVLWASDIDGLHKDKESTLKCFPESDSLYVKIFNDGDSFEQTFVSLNRTTGMKIWSWDTYDLASFIGSDGTYDLLYSYEQGLPSARSFDSKSGRLVWDISSEIGSLITDSNTGILYKRDEGSFSRIDAATGKVAWTHEINARTPTWYDLGLGSLFLISNEQFSRLDPATGKPNWMLDYDLGREFEYNGETQFFKSGLIGLSFGSLSSNSIRQVLIDSMTGKALWELKTYILGPDLLEDAKHEIWLRDGKKISPVDARTGHIRWTFELESNQERIFKVLDSDPSRIFVTFGSSQDPPDSKYAPMGVLALDRTNGKLLWKNWFNEPVFWVGSDSAKLYLNVGFKSEDSFTGAFIK